MRSVRPIEMITSTTTSIHMSSCTKGQEYGGECVYKSGGLAETAMSLVVLVVA